jgi:hypothetical protein
MNMILVVGVLVVKGDVESITLIDSSISVLVRQGVFVVCWSSKMRMDLGATTPFCTHVSHAHL